MSLPAIKMVVAKQSAAWRWRRRRSVLRRSWPQFDHHELVASTIQRSPSRTGCFFPGSLVPRRWMLSPIEYELHHADNVARDQAS